MSKKALRSPLFTLLMAASLLAGLAIRTPFASAGPAAPGAAATQVDLHGPPGSGQFGIWVFALPNGNVIVTDPYYSAGVKTNVGAVYLYNGRTRALISTLTGSQAGDVVGYDRVTVLSNSNYVVESSYWANGAAAHAGAATWCSGTLGCAGVVTTTNSLVGSQANDRVASNGITLLSNGNYVVDSYLWANGPSARAGAATWCSGSLGCTGVVTTTNSLVGSQTYDLVGNGGITALTNGNYAVGSDNWANGASARAGAATWCSGTLGCTGVVTTSNSLVGSQTNDQVGQVGYTAIIALSNGNFVLRSPNWANGALAQAGAVTWGDGAIGITGVLTTTNSVLGGVASGGVSLNFAYDYFNDQLVVGRPAENLVTFFGLPRRVYLPLIRR